MANKTIKKAFIITINSEYSVQINDTSLISDEIMPTMQEVEMEVSGILVIMEA